MTPHGVAVGGAILVAFLLAWAWVDHRASNRKRPHECEVCGDKLTEKAARHLVAVMDNNDIGEQGGWAMTATYCRKHFPK